MEEVKIQEELPNRRRKSYLLTARAYGCGCMPKRRRELESIRKAIVIDRPDSVSEADSILIALNRLSERDFRNPRRDSCSYVERYKLID